MSERLTTQQKQAVQSRGSRLLVSAAAGSGKTKVLVDRLFSYLLDQNDPANIDDFLIITYTKAAASELRGKISDKLTDYVSEHPENKHMQQQIQRLYLAKISTVHGFCADVLRQYAYRLDIAADFRIAEESECQEIMLQTLETVLDRAYSENLHDDYFRGFVDSQGLGRDDRQVPEILLQIYRSALCHMDPESWLKQCVDVLSFEEISDAGQTIWGKYLMDDLRKFLSLHIASLTACVSRAQEVPGLEKPVDNLKATIQDLKSLYACQQWDEIVRHPPVTFATLSFKKEHRNTVLADQIKAVRNACKDSLPGKLRIFSQPSADVLSDLQAAAVAAQGIVTLVKEFRDQYDRQKRIRRVLDFSDIEQKTLDLLYGKHRTGITAIADEIGSNFREIMVDEYQDSNEVQDAIFSALTRRRENCFMVGDVKQSIYQFRLADPEIFLHKYQAYSSIDESDWKLGRKILLSKNFRSAGSVITAVNDVFYRCMTKDVGGLDYTEAEALQEGIPHVPLGESEIELYGVDVCEDTYGEEAAFVAQRIRQLLDENCKIREEDSLRPITLDDIVILLRSPGSVGGEFQYALEEQGIPCTMGNDADLLQTPEVETLRSILQIIHNPLQDIPLAASMLSPVFGFTADELAEIRSRHKHCPLFEAINNTPESKTVQFLETLSLLRKQARFLTVTQLIHQVFVLTDILSVYSAMEDGNDRVRNLHSFSQIATDFESTGRKELSYFLDYLLTLDISGLPAASTQNSGCVRIMSIHKSKGLEFPVVFLCGLSRAFNRMDLQKQVLCHKDLGLGLVCVNETQRVRYPTIAKRAIAAKITEENISEELRVLYVAMTRAKDRLIMTYSAQNLASRLQDIVLRMDLSAKELLARYPSCPGTWILLAALSRSEAGAFFSLAGYPDQRCVSDNPWNIQVVEVKEMSSTAADAESPQKELDLAIIRKMETGLHYVYPYQTAVTIPSKITATQMKGRIKDQEAAENTVQLSDSRRILRSATVSAENRGIKYGNAMHSVMQNLDYAACGDEDAIQRQVAMLCEKGLLSDEQANMVKIDEIIHFIRSPLGQKLTSCSEVLREFKFSILVDSQEVYPEISGEKILLQGVIDCALIEHDGITVLDFKTDYVSEDTLEDVTLRYLPQVKTYAKAISRIYGKPIKAAYLYFFRMNRSMEIM